MTKQQGDYLVIDETAFTKDFHCDRCGGTISCAPDFDPPGCPTCNPELWNGKPE